MGVWCLGGVVLRWCCPLGCGPQGDLVLVGGVVLTGILSCLSTLVSIIQATHMRSTKVIFFLLRS